MSSIYKILVILLSIGFGLYTVQVQVAISVLLFYGLGALFLRLFFNSKSKTPREMYDLFFVIYGCLVLFSHIQLIHDPYEDFFIHNDAPWSFYHWTMDIGVDYDWNRIIEGSLFNPFFSRYPLASLIFTVLAKVGIAADIENIRLFLRIHVFMMGAQIPAIMACLLSRYEISDKLIKKYIISFGLFSYLFITSAIFSRDLHVCFAYTLMGYYILSPKSKHSLWVFALIFLLAFGFRPDHGLLILLFIAGYYYVKSVKKLGMVVWVFVGILFVGCYMLFQPYFQLTEQLVLDYNGYNSDITGGVFEKFFHLPFPINLIIMVIYMLIMPLPATKYLVGIGNSWLTIPFLFSPYLMLIMVGVVIWYLFHKHSENRMLSTFMLVSIVAFFAIVYSSPDLRRAFPIVPGMYMAYCICRGRGVVPTIVIKNLKSIGWPIIFAINLFFLFYVML